MDKYEWIDRFREAVDASASTPGILALPRWTPDQWAQFAGLTEPLTVEAGDAVIATGSAERALYLVVSGTVEVAYVVRQSLTVSIMTQVPAGSVVGELAFFDAAPRSANVWAVEDSQLLRVSLRDFERFAEGNPRMAYDVVFALGRIVAYRLRSTTSKVTG